jgi:hypothetical protein
MQKNADKDNFGFLESSNWITPVFVHINKIKIKRLSPYFESELLDKDEIVSLIKYSIV